MIGNAPDANDEDVELMQKKIETDLSEIVERILLQNTDIVDDKCADQIDFATFLEIYAAIAECKSSHLSSSQSIPASPTIVCDSTIASPEKKRKETEDVEEKVKKSQKKL